MKRLFVTLVIVLAGLAYLGGYWPERERRLALEGQVTRLQVELVEAQAKVRLGGLLGQILAVEDAVSAQNYGQAQALSGKLFDGVRDEATQTAAGGLKDALDKVVRLRDPVTASLTRGDPEALTLVRDAETLMRGALGFLRPMTP